MFALFHVGRARHRASQPQEIAPGVYCMETGKGIMRSNVYFVRSGSSWALIDTASANCGRVIQKAAESLFGANTRPAAILLTHSHPDHAGSTLSWPGGGAVWFTCTPTSCRWSPETSQLSSSMAARSTSGSSCH